MLGRSSAQPASRSATRSCCRAPIHFLTSYDTEHFRNLVQAKPYYNFVVTVLVGIVVIFQTPLAILGLVSIGVLSSRTLRKQRRLGYLITAAIALALPGTRSRDDVPRAHPDVAAVRGVDLARRALRAAAPEARSQLGYPGRLMARAAVRAKQAQQAQAQAAANPSRKQRKHASGGNPNQDLFFMRLRRRQKWVFLALAVVFAVSFVALGVGSGSGAGLSELYNRHLRRRRRRRREGESRDQDQSDQGLQGSRERVRDERDLTSAISALQTYVAIKKKDAVVWAQLGGYEHSRAQKYATEYQNVLQASQLRVRPILPAHGRSRDAIGADPVYSTASQYSTRTTQLYTRRRPGATPQGLQEGRQDPAQERRP